METLIIIFIIAVLIIAIFCLAIVIREIIIEEKERRKKGGKTADVAPAKEQTSQGNVIKSEPVTTIEPVPIDDDSKIKDDVAKKTLDEKYLELERAYRSHSDEIAKTATEVENNKHLKNDSREGYKVGKKRFILLRIKRRKKFKKEQAKE